MGGVTPRNNAGIVTLGTRQNGGSCPHTSLEGVGFGTASFGLGAIGGLEYPVADNIGLFAELQPGFIIYAEYANEFSATLRIGGNYLD